MDCKAYNHGRPRLGIEGSSLGLGVPASASSSQASASDRPASLTINIPVITIIFSALFPNLKVTQMRMQMHLAVNRCTKRLLIILLDHHKLSIVGLCLKVFETFQQQLFPLFSFLHSLTNICSVLNPVDLN